jgi:DNA-binding transcriptional LysR family regulator
LALILPLMEKIGVELKHLANFISACQNSRISETATNLGQTPSAVSTALHNLEDRMGLRLFVRQGSYLGLLPAAFWLFQHGCQLLYLEHYARGALPLITSGIERLVVRLDLSFAIGRFSKALIVTAQEMLQLHPETFIEWRFASPADEAEEAPLNHQLEAVFASRTDSIDIFYTAGSGEMPTEAFHILDDPWIAVGSAERILDLSTTSEPMMVMKMRPRLIEGISQHAKRCGFDSRLRFLDDDPSQIGRLLLEFPHLRFLMPASMLAGRMGISRVERSPFTPALVSPLLGRAENRTMDKANIFLQMLRRNLSGKEQNIVFDPQLTVRQIQYFNQAVRTGRISAAARVANVAQSSISAQIQKMETAIGAQLLERRGDGTGLSSSGARFLPFTTEVEDRQIWLLRKSRDIAAHTQANVKIGTLPSSGHDSALTEKIAQAITIVLSNNPTWKLEVSEDSNAILHDKIRAGELNLAIVGAAQSQVARISLGPSEPLSVVANPLIQFDNMSEMSLAEVCKLPLVLGPRHLSIHQNFARAAQARKLQLIPVVEVGSLALAIAMVRTAKLCTVLPSSSVRKDVEAGLLVAVPISNEDLSGKLSVIFSVNRSLSVAERIIIQELVHVFKAAAFSGSSESEGIPR